jgi:hypothetical protein
MSYGAPSAIERRPCPEHIPDWDLVPKVDSIVESRSLRASAPRLTIIGKAAANQNLLNDFELEERRRAYRVKLQATTDAEWRHEMTSGSDYRNGRRHFQSLWDEQAEVDPTGEIWRSIAPKGFAIPQPRYAGISCSQCGQGFGPGKHGFGNCSDHAHLVGGTR